MNAYVVILCGGRGTRLGGTEDEIPKPLVKIDNFPIVRHVMSSFYKDGWKKFILLTGFKAHMFDDWVRSSDIPKSWFVRTLYTGESALTGDRVKQALKMIREPWFFLTYGDGLGSVDTVSLLDNHWTKGKMMSMTVVHPPSRFGLAKLNGDTVCNFSEKPTSTDWINGGYMVLERGMEVMFHNRERGINLEKDILPEVAKHKQITAFKHEGFWQCMDTPRDVEQLRGLCKTGEKAWMRRIKRDYFGKGKGS